MKNRAEEKIAIGRLGVVFVVCITMVMTSSITAIGTFSKSEIQGLDSFHQMNYLIDFKEPTAQVMSCSSGSYATLSMPGCVSMGGQVGDPQIPVKVMQLLLPPKKAISSIEVTGTPVTVLPEINLLDTPIFPQQQPIPFGSSQPQNFIINMTKYSSDAFYPATTYSDYTVGYSHGYAILSLNLHPMQYNPTEGTLIYYPEMSITINLKDDTQVNRLYRNNPDDMSYVQTLVSNPDVALYYPQANLPVADYPGGLCDPSDHYDYVIVTTTENGLDHWDIGGTLVYNWNDLMAEHESEGLKCTEVTVQDINACTDYWNTSYGNLFNDTQAHVREFCRDAYSDWGTTYVLFAGDADSHALPPRLMDSGAEYGVDADLYWSNLDNSFNANHNSQWGEEGDSGFDLYSELAIGRLTCERPQDVSNWLTKSFYYASSSDSDYLDNAAFYGGDTTWQCQGDDFMDYSAVKGTSDWLGPNPDYYGPFPSWVPFQFGFETWNLTNPGNMYDLTQKWTMAPSPNPGWQGNGVVGLRNAINDDLVTFISGIAHANNQMSLDVDASQWESQYHNTRPFFIHDYGCHCGDFDEGNGILDTMLFWSDTKLSFGCVYNTGYGWGDFYSTNSSSAFQAKEFWGWFLDTANNSGDLSHWQFGVAQAWSKDQMAPMIDWSGGSWRETIQCCLLFGDPAQMFKTPHPSDAPEQPSKPVGKTMVCWNRMYNYTSSTTDPNGDQIYYLFNWDDGTTSGWLGPYNSGQTVTGSHMWTTLGNFSVTVRARDVWGAGSMPSDSLQVWVRDDTEPSAPTIQGPTQTKPHGTYTYIVNATSEFDHDLLYEIDWGDGHGSSGLGPYHSGEAVNFTHTWTKKGTYVIKARATDVLGMQGDWSTLQVVAPLPGGYQFSFDAFLQHLFERFPHLFPILRHLMGY
ncbi:MAG TPA: C25 family cysteine peptidase [Candidatus Thermoplasmatota archaeon]|nr:C25 family cysteine peptidase [Candidatus Thermoplasmatota archaeon]